MYVLILKVNEKLQETNERLESAKVSFEGEPSLVYTVV